MQQIREALSAAKPRVEAIESQREEALRTGNSASSGSASRRVVDKLREEWSQVNRGYTEAHR